MIDQIKVYHELSVDPLHNLAMEEYLTEQVEAGTCVLYLWKNRHTVVIGRNQNAWKECRVQALKKDGGTLVRRLSGGGAVYHDMGNLNFTFCVRTNDYDLRKQQQVLIEACDRLGIYAECSGRNDLLAEGRKFSGNSFYSHKGQSFHNGTILVNADLVKMGQYLCPSKAKMESKGVESVRSRVINLNQLHPGLTIQDVAKAMTEAFSAVYGLSVRHLSQEQFDSADIQKKRDRFASEEWIYGRPIPFTFSCSDHFDWGEITIEFKVNRGICEKVAVYTDAMDAEFAAPLAQALTRCPFTSRELNRRIAGLSVCDLYQADLLQLLTKEEECHEI